MTQTMPVLSKLRRPSKRAWIIGGTVLLVILLIGLNVYRVKQKDVVPVKAAVAVEDKIESVVIASGRVIAPNREDIVTQVSGTVTDIKVKLGQEVEAGQPLLVLQSTDAVAKIHQAEATMATAEANLASARASGNTVEYVQAQTAWRQAEANWQNARQQLERMETLYKEGAVSQEQLEAARLDLDLKEAQYRSAQAQFEAAKAGAPISVQALEAQVAEAKAALEVLRNQASPTGLKAPRGGRVLQINVNKGDAVNPNTLLITVGDLTGLEIETDISEVDIDQMKVGQPVLITGNAVPDAEYAGTVKEIGLMAVTKIKNQGEVTSVKVVIGVPEGTDLKPGYNVDLNITTASQEVAVVVPFEAVVEKDKQTQVFVVEDGVAKLKPVKTGISDELRVQIVEGVKAGDQVVINPEDDLTDGTVVKVQ